jgi:hypothetical protein
VGQNWEGMLFLDQEKCFDRLNHEWVYKVLARYGYGYGEGLIGWIWAFYNGVYSRVLVNGHFTDHVQIGRGLRQGDPPSSLLYILTAEVMANSVRKDGRIEGLRVNGVENKIGGYADDTQGFVPSDESLRQFLGKVSLF